MSDANDFLGFPPHKAHVCIGGPHDGARIAMAKGVSELTIRRRNLSTQGDRYVVVDGELRYEGLAPMAPPSEWGHLHD